MLGPSSVTSLQFDSIIHSMSDEELENCIDLLGSFDINPELAIHIWSRTKEKVCLLKNYAFKLNYYLFKCIGCFTHVWFCFVGIIGK